MSKAILVMDMPKNCLNCKMADWANCRITKICHTGCYRPDWCPLSPMPEKKAERNAYTGYNQCIDEIGGKNETDKETHQST